MAFGPFGAIGIGGYQRNCESIGERVGAVLDDQSVPGALSVELIGISASGANDA